MPVRKKHPPVIQSPPVKGSLKVAEIRRAVRLVKEARERAEAKQESGK